MSSRSPGESVVDGARICELCLNPASYVTGGYNKKQLKNSRHCAQV